MRWRCRAWPWAVGMALAVTGSAWAAEPDARRSGTDFLGPALRALQADEAQHPALLWVKEGQALWSQRPGGAAKACADCHGAAASQPLADAAARYPAWDEASQRPLTLAQRVDRCRQRHQGQAPQDADGPELLALQALLAQSARGRPIQPPADPRLAPARQRGQALFQQRLGQLDLSCAQCHDQRAGLSLGGATIPQAHPTGVPSYRLQWQGLGSLQRRLRNCLVGVRAEPFAPDAPQWVDLELHLMQRAAGMPLEGPALRP